jgi:hypothetical protein
VDVGSSPSERTKIGIMKNLNKVSEALRKAVALAREHPQSLDMKELSIYQEGHPLLGRGRLAYHLALTQGVPDEYLVLKSLDDHFRLQKLLVNAVLESEKNFGKSLNDLHFLSRWPKEFLDRYYEVENSPEGRVEVLNEVVEYWIKNNGKFPKMVDN